MQVKIFPTIPMSPVIPSDTPSIQNTIVFDVLKSLVEALKQYEGIVKAISFSSEEDLTPESSWLSDKVVTELKSKKDVPTSRLEFVICEKKGRNLRKTAIDQKRNVGKKKV